jgi:hypothetical protein
MNKNEKLILKTILMEMIMEMIMEIIMEMIKEIIMDFDILIAHSYKTLDLFTNRYNNTSFHSGSECEKLRLKKIIILLNNNLDMYEAKQRKFIALNRH